MITPAIDDFDVDLKTRKVVHRPSRVELTFPEFEDEASWLSSLEATIHPDGVFRGPTYELVRVAKEAAIREGMTHRKR
jgi:hypothetical protein